MGMGRVRTSIWITSTDNGQCQCQPRCRCQYHCCSCAPQCVCKGNADCWKHDSNCKSGSLCERLLGKAQLDFTFSMGGSEKVRVDLDVQVPVYVREDIAKVSVTVHVCIS